MQGGGPVVCPDADPLARCSGGVGDVTSGRRQLLIGALVGESIGEEPAQLLVWLFAVKALALATLAAVLLVSAPLDATLKAAHALRVPGLLIQLALLSYRYLFVLGDELARLRIALRCRRAVSAASRARRSEGFS